MDARALVVSAYPAADARGRIASNARLRLLTGVGLAALLAGPVQAQTTQWIGVTSTDWQNAANWSNGVPLSTTATTIDTVAPFATVLDGTVGVSGSLDVGRGGTGFLTISGGGSVSSSEGVIGRQVGSSGSVTLTGAGSAWVVPNFYLAYGGSGELVISNGASLQTVSAYIAGLTGSTGFANATGAGTTWVNSGTLFIGERGTGFFNIVSGAAVTANDIELGSRFENGVGANGIVYVTGANSSLIAADNLYVGRSGSGSLEISGGGLVQSNFAWLGLNTGSSGVVIVSGAGSLFDVGTLLTVGEDGSAGLIIQDGGTVRVQNGTGNIDLADSPSSNASIVIGASIGMSPTAPGTLSAQRILFGDGAPELIFNHTAESYTFSPVLQGSIGDGLISVLSGTTVLDSDSSGYGGVTVVTGGKLVVNGTLGGVSLRVSGGGILGGSGTVGPTIVGAGGIVAPGNSIGTLNVNGPLTFDPGSVYEVETEGNASDLIAVTGTATLNGGTVVLTGNPVPMFDYQILSATGGVTGTFAGVNDSFAFLDALLAYGANNVTLRLERNNVAFASAAVTPNQKAAASGLDSLTFGNPIYDAFVRMDVPAAQQAFDQLSGEVHASGITALIGNSGNLRSIVSRRFQSVFANRQAATSFPLTSYASWGSSAEQASGSGHAAWGQIFGSWGRTRGDGNAARLRHDDGGFLVGADAVLAETWSVGAFTGYSRSTFRVGDRNSSGASDNFHLGFYGGTEIGALRLNLGAAHSWHDLDTRRTVSFPGFSETLSASYSARTAQIFGEAGYRLDMGGLSFEPFAGLAYVHTTVNSFTETGGAAALTAAGSTTATTFSTLGLRAFSQFDMGGVQATVRGMVGWRHAFGDTVPTTRLNFAGGTGFSVYGAPIAKDAALVEAGLDLAVGKNVTVGLSYDGQYSRRTQEHGFNARLRVAF